MVAGAERPKGYPAMLRATPEQFVSTTGWVTSWLTLMMVIAMFAIVLLRYGFNMGWIWSQELVTYWHAMVFMLVAPWAFKHDDHVRVDIFYRDSSRRHKARVNLFGIFVFLIPYCVFMLAVSWDYVFASWQLLEGSREAGGIPAVFLLKSLLLAMPALMLVQAGISAAQEIAFLKADLPPSPVV